ncbi:unnamed protein product [Bursaphelenchus okinawaensis]|uniref:aECM cysteine-cradle domain-containing protein n=1 Tax=Bursaphelenchus okinawaensis TaxID=465554 RepID=A0A811L181_9BILA|nr:unnamed protein product [Bursaphelenchus okinawaensis]CAG9115110.1 unnamed protein product [Bursaphelenchus okinawaensis]
MLQKALTISILVLAVTCQEKKDDNKPSKVLKDDSTAPMTVKIMDQVDKALEQPERFLDVREFIKSALDMMRTYPAPEVVKKIPSELQRQQYEEQREAYLQHQRQNYVAPRAYSARTYSPYQQNQQQDSQYGPKPAIPVQPQSSDAAKVLSRIFATPTQKDMESLFHLPADIMHRLASDAGYIAPHKEPAELEERYSSSASGANGGFFGGGSPGTFSLGGTADSESGSFTTQFGDGASEAVETTTAIPVAAPPKVMLRTYQQGGKLVQVPVLAVRLPTGETRYIPYEKLSDFSDALSKAISTGQLPVNEDEKLGVTTPRVVNAQFAEAKPGAMFNFPENLQVEPPTTSSPVNVRTETVEGSSFVQQFDNESNENKDAETVSEPAEHRYAPTARSPNSTAQYQPSSELLALLEKLGQYKEELDHAVGYLQTTKAPVVNPKVEEKASEETVATDSEVTDSESEASLSKASESEATASEVVDATTKDEFPKPNEMKEPEFELKQEVESLETTEEPVPTTKSTSRASTIKKKTLAPSTTLEPETTTSTTPAPNTAKTAGEVVLNGRRYKLVEAEEEHPATTEVTEATEALTEAITSTAEPKKATVMKTQKLNMKSNLEQVRNLARQNRLRQPTIRKALPNMFGEVTADTTLTPTTIPQHRIYSLRELEDIIASETGHRPQDSEEERTFPRRPLTSQQLLSAGRVTSANRADLLRQEYMLEKTVWRERAVEAFRNFEDNPNDNIEERCRVANEFSRRFFIDDLSEFAKLNCDFVEDYIPVHCHKLAEFYENCDDNVNITVVSSTPSSTSSTVRSKTTTIATSNINLDVLR